MPGLEFRYVGQDRLPTRLSEFDVERYFALTDSDVAAVNERFRRDRRAGAAIQLIFLRASGHTLDHVGSLPRQLLRYVGERLGLPTPTIASLRTLYQRYETLYKHQAWTCEYLGMTSISPSHWVELKARMLQDATESLTLDELLPHAHCWLYEHRILIPAERKLRDLGRAIWSDVERGLLARIEATVTEAQLVHADAVLSSQHGTSGMRVLEWLKTPPARHSPRRSPKPWRRFGSSKSSARNRGNWTPCQSQSSTHTRSASRLAVLRRSANSSSRPAPSS
jgi:Domain of unknown function (DUF4158)